MGTFSFFAAVLASSLGYGATWGGPAMHTITTYLGKLDVRYETLQHRHTLTAHQTISECGVPQQCMAKGVLFCDADSYVLAVVPAGKRVDQAALSALLGRREVTLASEDELAYLFPDCELGAVPAVGAAYGVSTIVDEALLGIEDVYLEAGDHQSLVRIAGEDFRRLMTGVSAGELTHHEIEARRGRSRPGGG
jgi:Ala-tRNA(Pro) deacylase